MSYLMEIIYGYWSASQEERTSSIRVIVCLLFSMFWFIMPKLVKKIQDCTNEALFGIMEKTLQLLEMGFSENGISAAFAKCGELIMQIWNFSILALDGPRKTIINVR